MKTKSGVIWIASSWLLIALSVSLGGAYGERLTPEQLNAMPPEALIQAWGKAGRSEDPVIVEALIKNRSSSLKALRQAALSGTMQEKLFACALIAEMRDKDSVNTLLAATNDPEEKVQTRAVTALRVIGDPRAASRVRELVKTTSEGLVLKSSLVALGTLGRPEDASLIRPFLFYSDESIQVNAAAALALLGNEEGQRVLLESSHSENPLARLEATVALGYLNTPQAKTRLHQIINDPNGRWKNEALLALAQQQLMAELTTSDKIGYLRLLLQDQNRLVAGWAVEQLADLETPEATELLQDLEKGGEEIGQRTSRLLKLRGLR